MSLRLALHHLRAGGLHDVLAAIGVAVAVASFTYLLALGLGVRGVLLARIQPDGLVEVAKSGAKLDLLGLRLGLGDDRLGRADLERMAAVAGVAAVYPRAALAAPALAAGGDGLLGAGLTTELLGDGLPPELVAAELARPDAFRGPTPASGTSCTADRDCADGEFCPPAWWPGGARCRPVIPVVVSPALVEIFNGAVRAAYGTPELSPDAAIGLTLDVAFGRSSLVGRDRGAREWDRIRLVGYSRWAIPLGVTMPLAWVEELNRRLDPAAPARYRSAIVRPQRAADLAAVVARLRALGFAPVERGAARAVALLGALLAAVAAAGLGVVAVAGTHVAHVFLMHVVVRAREIALMRSVGATRGDIVALVLWQAVVVGLGAGLVGVGVALAAATATDAAVGSALAALADLPGSVFAFPWWLLAGGLAAAVVTSVVSALPPALRAARTDPAAALRGP